MSIFTKDNFPQIKSEPNWFWTWCIRGVFYPLFGSLFLLFYISPVLFYIDGTTQGRQFIIFGIIYYPILIGLSFMVLRYFIRIKSKAVRHIRINREGIFYEQIDGTTESLLYRQLEKSSENFNIYDVFIGSDLIYTGETTYRQTFLKVFLQGKEQEMRPFHPDVSYSYYAGNSRLLRSHFIQGITLFRPELRIAPNVFSEFSIHPETFEFDKKEYWKTVVIAIIFIILVFIAIEWYMKYRFGSSLLF